MDYTDVQQVCLNGHQITDSIHTDPSKGRKFCPSCGEKTITNCQFCNSPIPGHTYYDRVIGVYTESVPAHCHNCGKPYPWTEKKSKLSSSIVNKNETHDHILIINILCSRFHLVVKQLRERYDNRATLDVNDEYDVQDLLHSMLKIFFDDIRPEEVTPSYAGKSSRMDFLISEYEIVIETKMTRKGLGSKEIGSQLIEDIARYKAHPKCKTLICFVYDPNGYISNPSGIENDLSRKENGIDVKVMIIPKGY